MRALVLAALIVLGACHRRPEVPILNYHSIGDVADGYTVPRAEFARQLDWIASHGFVTASLHDLGAGALPNHAVILTFDDGKEDAVRVVLPMLRERRLRGTFFVITGEVGKAGYLDWAAVRALADAGMEIGSHTATHRRLPDLPEEEVRRELVESRRAIEQSAGVHVEALAYPFNASRGRLADAVRDAGYRVAVSGADHGGAGLFELYRFPVNGFTPLAEIEKFVSGRAQQ